MIDGCLTDDFLKHAQISDTYIYKHTSPQIRIQYKYLDNRLAVINYYFIDSEDMDKNYSNYMRKDYEILKNSSFTNITFFRGDL